MILPQEYSMEVTVPTNTSQDDVNRLLYVAREEARNRTIKASLIGEGEASVVSISFTVHTLSGHLDAVNAIRETFGKLMESEEPEREVAGACA